MDPQRGCPQYVPDSEGRAAAVACLVFVPEYRILVCRPCGYAVWPAELASHFRGSPHQGASVYPFNASGAAADAVTRWPAACGPDEFAFPAAVVPQLPQLPLYADGLQCRLAPSSCRHICRGIDQMRTHWRKAHGFVPGKQQDGSRVPNRATLAARRTAASQPVCCQKFFRTRRYSNYFAVDPVRNQEAGPASPAAAMSTPSVADQVFSELASLEATQAAHGRILQEEIATTAVSPWLELTRWASYLAGFPLRELAQLARPPDVAAEPALAQLCYSLDRLVERAYEDVCADRINAFDQARINSFLQRPRASDRPLLVKLRKPTYRRYQGVWKGLLCFVVRTASPQCAIRLRHQLTAKQRVALEDCLLAASQCRRESPQEPAVLPGDAALDESCLGLCIALLDHDLRGDLFESVIVGYLAVLGIDDARGTLREACQYTPLSGLIKIAQMLVIRKAVRASERQVDTHPAEFLDDLRERFLLHGTRSPFSWACRLRMFAKKVRDSTTSLGTISWTDDLQAVSYKDICDLRITSFREFIAKKVEACQALLQGLLLCHPLEQREDLGVEFRMHHLVDNAAETAKGWSFLQHPENRKGPLPDRDRWLLERVLTQAWLQEEFCYPGKTGQAMWRPKAVRAYMSKVDAFLEMLLLLMHITAGQPARSTELLGLRYMNTIHGHHRNIFIDRGLVSTVLSYHKGYNVTGSTKIIHRYLPSEVGELLVFYLWLVLPFCQKLDLLASRRSAPPSPFLWAHDNGKDCWSSARLSRVIERGFKDDLQQKINISTYRHLAIAISRKHLACGGFKRDYGLENSTLDKQAAHSSLTASSVYARGLGEAPGHIEERKSEYRAVSYEWHRFLGFAAPSLPPRKRPLEESGAPTAKRPHRAWDF